jgi:hypothetical protein
MIKAFLASVALTGLAAPALAQPPSDTKPQQPTTTTTPASTDAFKKQDKNGDGAITMSEAKAADAKLTDADFNTYDTDKNKTLSLEEYSKMAEARSTPPASAPG